MTTLVSSNHVCSVPFAELITLVATFKFPVFVLCWRERLIWQTRPNTFDGLSTDRTSLWPAVRTVSAGHSTTLDMANHRTTAAVSRTLRADRGKRYTDYIHRANFGYESKCKRCSWVSNPAVLGSCTSSHWAPRDRARNAHGTRADTCTLRPRAVDPEWRWAGLAVPRTGSRIHGLYLTVVDCTWL